MEQYILKREDGHYFGYAHISGFLPTVKMVAGNNHKLEYNIHKAMTFDMMGMANKYLDSIREEKLKWSIAPVRIHKFLEEIETE